MWTTAPGLTFAAASAAPMTGFAIIGIPPLGKGMGTLSGWGKSSFSIAPVPKNGMKIACGDPAAGVYFILSEILFPRQFSSR